ncbi:MAG: glycosyltransferase family 29 protein [Fulvimarina manganoxydans]|uniref:glycosyltransferase family 29 protein n=1 Tax=Fulvimarina manganoxydans TaxID=937218 RepID=UPI00235576F7|nr:glycosyltransferase family 29 protein [Fulvimarina manganoxydans]MCK5930934.1 glycosyltransferase family 29 protein [Fulvimarina manganoxydans]
MKVERTDIVASSRQPIVRLVGNGPVAEDRSQEIDGTEVVVRFNNAAGFGTVNGTRTTHLFLINCGGQAREWLANPGFVDRASVRTSGEILLPIHPAKDDHYLPPLSAAERGEPDARNHAADMVSMLERSDKAVTVLSPEIFLKACRIIGYERPERGMAAPSTGLIALVWALQTFDMPIAVSGFSFEGWPGHRWEAERAFFEAQRDEGRLRLGGPA